MQGKGPALLIGDQGMGVALGGGLLMTGGQRAEVNVRGAGICGKVEAECE